MRLSQWLAVWSLAGLAKSDGGKEEAPRVNTTSGAIIGHRSPHRPNTFEFLGIKYGEAPVGALRFAPPKRYNAPPDLVYNASNWVTCTCIKVQ